MTQKILVINKIEDILDKQGNIEGKKVFNKQGDTVKVKKGQAGALAKRWEELQVGLAFRFTMGEFKGYPFVEDFEKIEDIFVKQAAEKVADDSEKTKRASIESQTAFNGLVQLYDKLPEATQLLIIAWALDKMCGDRVTYEVPARLPKSSGDGVQGRAGLDNWEGWFKKALPLVQLTQADLLELGLPAKDARKTDQFHYAKDILNDDQRILLFEKMNEQLDPENQIAL